MKVGRCCMTKVGDTQQMSGGQKQLLSVHLLEVLVTMSSLEITIE